MSERARHVSIVGCSRAPIECSALLALLVAVIACGAERSEGQLTLEQALATSWEDLDQQVVTTMRPSQKGGRAIVFLHGYGRTGTDYAPLARGMLGERTRVFLPTAALRQPTGRGAMWWEFIEGDWPKPYSDDPTAIAWPEPSRQLPRARDAIVRLISRIRRRYEPDAVVLAGHSQGAMLALDVAMSVEPLVDRVVIASAYVLIDSIPSIEKPRDDRPAVLISHGRGDELVAFDAAERAKRLLEQNGFAVRFEPHDGDHRFTDSVVGDVRDFVLSEDATGLDR